MWFAKVLEDTGSPKSNYDDIDVPSPDFPQSNKSTFVPRSVPSDSGYAGSSRRPSEENYRRPSEENYRKRPSEDAMGNRSEDGAYSTIRRPSDDSYGREGLPASLGTSITSRRKPSQDTVSNLRNEERRRASPEIMLPRRSGEEERELARKPSGSVSTTSDSTNATNAQREMIIPNKSTIAEEEIEVPYGRERESTSTAMGGRASRSPDTRDRSPDQRGDTDGEPITDNEPSSSRSAQPEVGGLSGLSARFRDRALEDEDEEWSGQGRSGEEYYDKMSFGRASVASDRSTGPVSGSRTSASLNTGRMSRSGGTMGEDVESLRREYEYKIATMQSRLTALERQVADGEERERRLKETVVGGEKVKVLEEEIKLLREVRDKCGRLQMILKVAITLSERGRANFCYPQSQP